ncbi:BTAD domain-containing putative transcriptional regulator [Streptomyces sp. PU-14G]|uniref:BTAD domain-containing putative transcriptional regulator n=1 Tax=Streptomyces sp. PU-14G TaxID=2800808 RepID=UPI0034DFAAE4
MARRSSTPAPDPRGPGSRSRSRTPVPVRTRRTVGDVLKAFLAFVALAALVVGVPLALASFLGWPLPRRMPSFDMLRDEVSVGVFVNVLTVVVWLAWAQFTACVLVEAKAALSGVGLPARVPGAGPSQLLARQLVAALLLLGSSTGSFAPGLAELGHTMQPHQPQQTVASAQLTPGTPQAAPGTAHADSAGLGTMGGHGSGTDVVLAGGSTQAGAAGPASTRDVSRDGNEASTKFYRIQPPEGRHHDSLWEIAQRHLGDGRRYKEIYRLNKDRLQPDGSRLSEASLIRPGWIMEMPADAHGGELVDMPDDAEELGERERAQYERYQAGGGAAGGQGQDGGHDRSGDGSHGDGSHQDGNGARDSGSQDDRDAEGNGRSDDGAQRDGQDERDGQDQRSDSTDQPDRPTAPDDSGSDPGRDADGPGPGVDDDADTGGGADRPDQQPSVPDSSTDRPPMQPTPDAQEDGGSHADDGTGADDGAAGPDDTGADDGTAGPDDGGPGRGGPDETVDVAPDEHTPDRQEQSVPESPADRQPTRPDNLRDSTDDDGLPGPGIDQPDDIRADTPESPRDDTHGPGPSGDGSADRGGDRDQPRNGSRDDTRNGSREGSQGEGSQGEGSQGGGRGSGHGDETPTDLDRADGAEADRAHPGHSPKAEQADGHGLGPLGLPEALLGAPLLAAGILAALGRRRRTALWRTVTGGTRRAPADDFAPPSDPAARARDALLVGADPGAVRFLDLALRGLAEDLRAAGRPLPVVYAAWLTEQEVHLQLAAAAGEPPAPWRYGQSEAFWTLQRAHTRFDVDTAQAPPYPGLVSLGLRGQARLLLNLESVPGLVSVAGDPALREAVLASIAAELATGTWSRDLHLTLVGFGADLTALAPERMRHLPDVPALLAEQRESAQRETAQRESAQRETSAPRRDADGRQRVVLVGAEPTGEEARRLAALATEGDTGANASADGFVVGVSTGRLPMPSVVWEFDIDDDGTLAAPRMGLDVRAQQLPQDLRAAVLELFADTDDAQTQGSGGPGFRVDLSESGRPAVYARLMGGYEVTGVETPEENRGPLLHEALALLLLNRDGVHPRVLASALWPKGVTDDVRDALVERLRHWLGHESDGAPRLATSDDGRLALRPSVVSDWDVLRTLHHGCTGERGAKLSAVVRRAQLSDALGLARGPLLADRPAGRYGWLTHHVAEAQHPVLVAEVGLALATEHLRAGEPGAAVRAVRSALHSAPADERLWEQLVRAAHATGERGTLDEAVRWVVERADPVRGVPPRTAALLDEFAPGWSPAPTPLP